MASEHELQVGDSVWFRFGPADVIGRIQEDRGPIGVGGRRLYLIAFQLEPSVDFQIELPADELRIQDHELIESPR